MVALKASSLSRSFKEKTTNAKEKIVSRFVASHGLKHRMGTHKSQRDPRETATEALDYMQHVRVKTCTTKPTCRLHHKHGSNSNSFYFQFQTYLGSGR